MSSLLGKEELLMGLHDFNNGITLSVFHLSGIMRVAKNRGKTLVRYFTSDGPKFFYISMLIPSGPMALEALDFCTSSLEKISGVQLFGNFLQQSTFWNCRPEDAK